MSKKLFSEIIPVYVHDFQPGMTGADRRNLVYAQPNDLAHEAKLVSPQKAINWAGAGSQNEPTGWGFGPMLSWLDDSGFDNVPLTEEAKRALDDYPYPKFLFPTLEPWHISTWNQYTLDALNDCLTGAQGAKKTPKSFAARFYHYARQRFVGAPGGLNTLCLSASANLGPCNDSSKPYHTYSHCKPEQASNPQSLWAMYGECPVMYLSPSLVQQNFQPTYAGCRLMTFHPLTSPMVWVDPYQGVAGLTEATYDSENFEFVGDHTKRLKSGVVSTKKAARKSSKKTAASVVVASLTQNQNPSPKPAPAPEKVETFFELPGLSVVEEISVELEPEIPPVIAKKLPEEKAMSATTFVQQSPLTSAHPRHQKVGGPQPITLPPVTERPITRDSNADPNNVYVAQKGDMRGQASPWEQKFNEYRDAIPALHAMQKIRRTLSLAGFALRPEAGGKFAGYAIYARHNLTSVTPGVSVPAGFSLMTPMSPAKDADLMAEILWKGGQENFAEEFKTIARLAGTSSNDSDVCDYNLKIGFAEVNRVKKIYEEMVTQMLGYGTTTSKINNLAVTEAERTGVYPVSLIGKTPSTRWLPPTNCFSPAVQQITAEELFNLMPDAERQAIMLTFGRAVTGANGEPLAEVGGTLQHTFRSFSLVVGEDAGMGKSTVFGEYMANAMTKLGYKVSSLAQKLGDFSAASAVSADLVYIDDLMNIEELLGHPDVKSMVSNGVLSVNQKHEKIRDVKARTCFLACTNKWDGKVWLNADSGIVSRFQILATKKWEELVNEETDNRPMFTWKKLADQAGVTVETLAIWALRLSANYFLTTIGYNPETLEKVAESHLEETVAKLRKGYRIPTNLTHVKELTEGVAYLIATTCLVYPDLKADIQYLTSLPLTYQWLVPYMAMAINPDNDRVSDLDGEMVLAHCITEKVNWKSHAEALDAKLSEWRSLPKSKTQSGIFEVIMSQLTSVDYGFGFPKSEHGYAAYWKAAISRLQVSANKLAPYVKPDQLPKSIRGAVKELAPLLREQVTGAKASSRRKSLRENA